MVAVGCAFLVSEPLGIVLRTLGGESVVLIGLNRFYLRRRIKRQREDKEVYMLK